jgi:hypothetical protein
MLRELDGRVVAGAHDGSSHRLKNPWLVSLDADVAGTREAARRARTDEATSGPGQVAVRAVSVAFVVAMPITVSQFGTRLIRSP